MWSTTAIDDDSKDDEADYSQNFDDGEYKLCFTVTSNTKEIDKNDDDEEDIKPSNSRRRLTKRRKTEESEDEDVFMAQASEVDEGRQFAPTLDRPCY